MCELNKMSTVVMLGVQPLQHSWMVLFYRTLTHVCHCLSSNSILACVLAACIYGNVRHVVKDEVIRAAETSSTNVNSM